MQQATTVGHDSEFGLEYQGNILSALDVFTPFENEHGRAFPDNMNCEIAINPVTDLKSFHLKTESLLDHVRGQGYTPIMKPVIKYPDECLRHPDAFISGCTPDLDSYLEEENIAPDFEDMDGTRSLGAHVHIAHGDDVNPYNLAKWMDVFLALPLLAKEEKTDRRSLYGGPGCIRIKPYGTEYRTLSNVWLADADLREFVWEGSFKALEKAKSVEFDDVDQWIDVPRAIASHDLQLASITLDRLYIYGVTSV